MTHTEYREGDPVWYAGYEHVITRIHDDGHVSLRGDGKPTIIGYTSLAFIRPRTVSHG